MQYPASLGTTYNISSYMSPSSVERRWSEAITRSVSTCVVAHAATYSNMLHNYQAPCTREARVRAREARAQCARAKRARKGASEASARWMWSGSEH